MEDAQIEGADDARGWISRIRDKWDARTWATIAAVFVSTVSLLITLGLSNESQSISEEALEVARDSFGVSQGSLGVSQESLQVSKEALSLSRSMIEPRVEVSFWGQAGYATTMPCIAEERMFHLDYGVFEAYDIRNNGHVGMSLISYHNGAAEKQLLGDSGAVEVVFRIRPVSTREEFLYLYEDEDGHPNPFLPIEGLTFVSGPLNIDPRTTVRILARRIVIIEINQDYDFNRAIEEVATSGLVDSVIFDFADGSQLSVDRKLSSHDLRLYPENLEDIGIAEMNDC